MKRSEINKNYQLETVEGYCICTHISSMLFSHSFFFFCCFHLVYTRRNHEINRKALEGLKLNYGIPNTTAGYIRISSS